MQPAPPLCGHAGLAMTTFIFIMSPEATSAQQTRMMSELEERFPQHDFLLGDVRFAGYERNILALLDDTGATPPNPKDVTEVIDFFRAAVDWIEDWKPS